MDVKEAVGTAKKYIQELFSEENIKNIGLEEVEYDEQKNEWQITIGFSRPWQRDNLELPRFIPDAARSYKIIRISEKTGSVISVKNRELAQ
jgi:hypothetical protein